MYCKYIIIVQIQIKVEFYCPLNSKAKADFNFQFATFQMSSKIWIICSHQWNSVKPRDHLKMFCKCPPHASVIESLSKSSKLILELVIQMRMVNQFSSVLTLICLSENFQMVATLIGYRDERKQARKKSKLRIKFFQLPIFMEAPYLNFFFLQERV